MSDALFQIIEKRLLTEGISQRIDAVAILSQVGLQWRYSKIPRLHIQGGREQDLSGTGADKIRVYRKAYAISEESDGTFTVMLVLDKQEFIPVPTLGEAVLLVLRKYREAGLL